MSSKKMLRNYQLLELEKDATPIQIEASYRRLLRLYSPGGLASYGLLQVSDRGRLLNAIKQAYQQLVRFSSSPPHSEQPKRVSPLAGAPDDLALLHEFLQNHPELESNVLQNLMEAGERNRTPAMQDMDESLPAG